MGIWKVFREAERRTIVSDCPVTVIMPAHNGEPYIAQAISSVLWQTYRNYKLWILENGSEDRTLQIARSFKDDRITVFELGKVGFRGALEFAIYNAVTPWLARMDNDDLMFPERLEQQMQVLKENPQLVLVGTHASILTPSGHILDKLPAPTEGSFDTLGFATGRGFTDPSVIFNRKAAIEAGGTDPEFSVGDIVLWFRLLSKGAGWRMADALHLYRLVPSSFSHTSGMIDECARVWRKYAPNVKPKWAASKRQTPFWAQVAALELTVGDRQAVRRAAAELDRCGERSEASRARWRARLGHLGARYYRFRNRNSYKHRLDLEDLFRSKLRDYHTGNDKAVGSKRDQPL